MSNAKNSLVEIWQLDLIRDLFYKTKGLWTFGYNLNVIHHIFDNSEFQDDAIDDFIFIQ